MSFGDTTSTGMTSLSGAGDSSQTATAFFDTRAHADSARRDLLQAGIPDSAITLTEGTGSAGTGTTSGTPRYHEEGFWESLKELFMPEEDRYTYAEGLRRGGYLLTVRAGSANFDRVMEILDRDGAVNLDERETSWRNEGWTGYAGGESASYTAPSNATAGFGASGADRMPVGGTGLGASLDSSSSRSSGSRAASVGSEETIPVLEEDLRIGKRDVSHGRVRVRSYVVETPVTEDVSLRSESVQVERRPVDRPATGADRMFQDRTIEAEQYAEEAVVQKDVRVKEEISLRKNVEQRTETVSDKVRRTEVEVEDERGNVVSPTTPGKDRKI